MSPSSEQFDEAHGIPVPAYAPRQSWHRDRLLRRRAVIAFSVLIAIISCYALRDVPRLWNLTRLQRKCLIYSPESNLLVYSELPRDIVDLPRKFNQYTALPGAPRAIAFTPACWVDFMRAYPSGGLSPTDPILFLGERANRAGQPRLVCAAFIGWGESRPWLASPPPRLFMGNYCPYFEFSVVALASPRSPPLSAATSQGSRSFVSAQQPPHNLRFYAGQRDEVDASRFVVAYELNGTAGNMEGIVNADDTVTLRVINGPLLLYYPDYNR